MADVSDASWVQVALAVVTIIGLVVREIVAWVHYRRAERDRATRAAEVKAEVKVAAAAVEERQKVHTMTMTRRLMENTQITRQAVDEAKAAYQEANSINQKIADIGSRFDALLEREDAVKTEQLDHIQETTDQTHDVVVRKLGDDGGT